MAEDVRGIRSEITRLQYGKPPNAVRYPMAVRRKVMALARRRRAQGADVRAVAREVGVAPWTLALWLRKSPSIALRAVDVVPDVPRESGSTGSGPVLITPQGIRVEGLDRDLLVAVLRALG